MTLRWIKLASATPGSRASYAQRRRIAPESRAIEIEPEVNFREQFDFDSLDFLKFAIALNKRCGVDIPELDYPKLSSLDGCVAYLVARSAAAEQV